MIHKLWMLVGHIPGARLCGHKSHKRGLPCFREFTYDGWCGVHNNKCWDDTCQPLGKR